MWFSGNHTQSIVFCQPCEARKSFWCQEALSLHPDYIARKVRNQYCVFTGASEPVPQVPRPRDQCWKQNLWISLRAGCRSSDSAVKFTRSRAPTASPDQSWYASDATASVKLGNQNDGPSVDGFSRFCPMACVKSTGITYLEHLLLTRDFCSSKTDNKGEGIHFVHRFWGLARALCIT